MACGGSVQKEDSDCGVCCKGECCEDLEDCTPSGCCEAETECETVVVGIQCAEGECCYSG